MIREGEMEIDLKKLRAFIDYYAKPRWEGEVDDWKLRKGGGERYLHDKVLNNAPLYLKEDVINKGSIEAFRSALNKDEDINSSYDRRYAYDFLKDVEENELRGHLIDLLYGPEHVEVRLRRFLDWAKVVPIPGTTKKKGVTAAIASYFLAMMKPIEYPFCKPKVYNSAVDIFLGKKEIRTDPVERFFHCQQFYTRILELLEKDYGLTDGNLLDVHSLFFFFNENKWALNKIANLPPSNYDLLMDKHNLVLYGPPGTGKTRDAMELAQWWREQYGPESVQQITFHPSYSYEDFIEGFRPTKDGSGFELQSGVFKRLCIKAGEDSNNKYLLVIDEINRGDVARILGELITLLEGDKRGSRYTIMLPGSKEPFYVPENIYVVGTMNTADKSISLMDLAIRRRFLFYPCRPKPEVLEGNKNFVSEIEGVRLADLLIGINQRLLEVGLNKDRLLGHSYFIISKDNPTPLEILKNRFRYEIYPLMEEYCSSDQSIIKRILGGIVDDWGMINEDVLDEDNEFISNLILLAEAR
jgi:hypothetical protein